MSQVCRSKRHARLDSCFSKTRCNVHHISEGSTYTGRSDRFVNVIEVNVLYVGVQIPIEDHECIIRDGSSQLSNYNPFAGYGSRVASPAIPYWLHTKCRYGCYVFNGSRM